MEYGCENRDPEIFFPQNAAGYAVAKAICNQACPAAARAACLEIAMRAEGSRATSGRAGVYGGLDEEERTKLWRKRDRERRARERAAEEAAERSTLASAAT